MSSSPSSSSLIELVRGRFFSEILAAVTASSSSTSDLESGTTRTGPHGGLVLVLDQHTLRLVSSACRRFDLTEAGVLFIEQLEKPRQPFADLDVVYFLTDASLATVDQMLRDHESGLYRMSHVFFGSGKINEAAMNKLTASSQFVARCRNLVETNLDFVPFEPKVFSSDQPLAVTSLDSESTLAREVDCLVSLLASLGERPVVRYLAGSPASQRVALGLRRATDEMGKTLKQNGTTVLVLDRSVETAGLLIHDFFYQALALDVLDGVDDHAGVKWALGLANSATNASGGDAVVATSTAASFEYKTVTGKGESGVRKVLLADTDPLWVRFRHEHFRVVSDQISRDIAQLGNGAGGDPLERLRGIPEYQDQIARLSVHVELSKQLLETFEKLGLMDVARIEQELATGVDNDGKEIVCAKLFQQLTAMCLDGRLGPEERLRLVMLYLSQVDDISEATAQDLVSRIARLDAPEFQEAVVRFLALGIHGTKTASAIGQGPVSPEGGRTGSLGKMLSQVGGVVSGSVQATKHVLKSTVAKTGCGVRGKVKKNKALAKSAKFVNCRFRSELAEIVELALMNQLEVSAFPSVAGTGASQYVTTPPNMAAGESTVGASSAAKWGQTVALSSAKRQRIIVFVIGGITLGEAREMAELDARLGVDVLLGGSTILTPKRFVEILLQPKM